MADFYPPFPSSSDPEDPSVVGSYSQQAPLLDPDRTTSDSRQPSKALVVIFTGLLALGLYAALIISENDGGGSRAAAVPRTGGGVSMEYEDSAMSAAVIETVSRGVDAGVSEKAFRLKNGEGEEVATVAAKYPWSNDMLSWQRTGFHFQPEKNWMNDPNGPLFYKGWYHFFYQYNPDAAVWGDIVWGHAVSRDLVNWLHLPLAMVADRWYDANGVWTGSATLLPNGTLIMLYTGSTNASVQVQNLAVPADPFDPLLLNWVKHPGNPVLVPPPGIDDKDFRDPTTAWLTPDNSTWQITIGSKVGKTGIALIYDTVDFKTYKLVDSVLHAVPGTGMWECVDFYPVSDETGISGSGSGGAEVKHVLKASLDDDKNDYYALGRYFHGNTSWVPDDPELDVGIGLRYDYGKFYASKTFYDQNKDRRVLWGWIMETDSEFADVKKGWASVQGIPRTVVLDKKTGSNLIQWPVEEVESLRTRSKSFDNVVLRPGTVMPIEVGTATQLDITAEFEIDKAALERMVKVEGGYRCSSSGGAAQRGTLGPFGLLVLADDTLSEQTPIYFYVAKGDDGNLKTFFCADESRSSKAGDVDKQIYGSSVPVLEGEKLSVRILVDHSIIESFVQGGRTCVTSRVYPTRAIHKAARLLLFNNATDGSITSSLKIWEMSSASMRTYTPTMPF